MEYTYNESATTPMYRYGLLPSDHIRLLQVSRNPNPKNGEPRLHCKMEVRPFNKNEPYKFTAISYTWGSPPRPTSHSRILVNGQLLEVRPNCEYALYQACDYDSQAWYWIDSVCIHQDDSTEKTQQVSHMGQIYKYARCVLACVGEHAAGSAELFAFFNKDEACAGISRRCRYMSGILSCCREAFPPATVKDILGKQPEQASVQKESVDVDFLKDVDKRLAQEMAGLWEQARPDKRMRSLWNQVNAFLCRPYFQRLWVFQELFLGTRVLFCCGDCCVPARLLNELFENLSLYYDLSSVSPSSSRCRPVEPEKEYWKIDDELNGTFKRIAADGTSKLIWVAPPNGTWTDPNLKSAQLLSAGASPGQITKGLREMLRIILDAELECEDARDRCFGILALVDWKGHGPIKPNYDKDIIEVAMEVLEVILSDEGAEEYCQLSELKSRAEMVAEVFRLDGQQRSGLWWTPRLATAIERRKSAALNSSTQQNISEPRRLKVFGQGFRLRELRGEWLLEGYRHPVTIVPFQDFSLDTLRMSLYEVVNGVFLPEQAEDGDWCFFFDDWLRLYRVVLFFRKSRPPLTNVFEIVGQGITIPGHDYNWGNWKAGTEFDAYLASEDLLISREFSQSIRDAEKSRPPDSPTVPSAQPSTFLQMSYCGHPGSSYVLEKMVARSDD